MRVGAGKKGGKLPVEKVNEHTRQMSSSSGILALGGGDHGSKYRGEVFVPGRQDMFPKAREP